MTTRHLILGDPDGNRLEATHLAAGAIISLNGWHIVLDPQQVADLAGVLLGIDSYQARMIAALFGQERPIPGLCGTQDAAEPSDGHPSTCAPERPAESRTANPDTWPEHPTDHLGWPIDPTDPDQEQR